MKKNVAFRGSSVSGALREFRAALRADPENSEALTNIGLVSLAQGRIDEALRSFNAALLADPNHMES